MSDTGDITVRLNVDIAEDLHNELSGYLPRGFKAEVYRALTRMLVRDLAKYGLAVLQPLTDDTATISKATSERPNFGHGD